MVRHLQTNWDKAVLSGSGARLRARGSNTAVIASFAMPQRRISHNTSGPVGTTRRKVIDNGRRRGYHGERRNTVETISIRLPRNKTDDYTIRTRQPEPKHHRRRGDLTDGRRRGRSTACVADLRGDRWAAPGADFQRPIIFENVSQGTLARHRRHLGSFLEEGPARQLIRIGGAEALRGATTSSKTSRMTLMTPGNLLVRRRTEIEDTVVLSDLTRETSTPAASRSMCQSYGWCADLSGFADGSSKASAFG